MDIESAKRIRQADRRRDDTFSNVFRDMLSPALDRGPGDKASIAAPILQQGEFEVITGHLVHEIQRRAVGFLPFIMQRHLHGVYKKPSPNSVVMDTFHNSLIRDYQGEAQIKTFQGLEVRLILNGDSLARDTTHLIVFTSKGGSKGGVASIL